MDCTPAGPRYGRNGLLATGKTPPHFPVRHCAQLTGKIARARDIDDGVGDRLEICPEMHGALHADDPHPPRVDPEMGEQCPVEAP